MIGGRLGGGICGGGGMAGGLPGGEKARQPQSEQSEPSVQVEEVEPRFPSSHTSFLAVRQES